ncbi:phosphatase PAP2 family protein [Paenibacillus chondroitinus]|uniref:Phosphatase PAP2 family protein n=1 Tax=Paenibacillus chondroitinus TaxID=59842 RepID=A0ABU6DAN1_9BACL|nr:MULTISPECIES: phosphatase PAP2 family protein [Paenibacillus]MCY9661074.1 phosphatase PAP2 family protein [Paenibacillus anseongense]MEB4794805.1 phosphatase PAP2 family protein [Paenibacillus chondroitinus]
MSPFQSMTHATVYIVITVIVFLIAATRKNPFVIAGSFVQEIFTSRKYLIHFAALITILFFNKLEMWVEKRIDYKADFTKSIYSIEGNFVSAIQHFFHNDILTVISSYFYVVIFPSVMIASIALYTFQKNHKLFYAICYALMFNYMIAIPFYLFFPVNEVWSFHPNVKLLILDVFPTFEQDYRPLSGLDNCFPSLHTSISVSMAVIAVKSRNTFWKIFVPISSAFIIFTIFYLGIHWLSDMCAGVVLGVVAARLGLRISEGRLVLGEQALLKRSFKNNEL